VSAQLPAHRGLTSAEVAERIARGETNAYKARVGRSYWDIVRDNLLNLFNIVMGTLLLVVLTFGDYATVFFAGFSVVTNSLLGMFQEIGAKRKLDQLAALSAPEIHAWRDGKLVRVKIAEIVKDDLIPLEPGDRLVVDGRVIHSDALEMDESQLTGESDAVLKEGGDPVFSGSFCIAGSGTIVATTVGKESTINKISSVAKSYRRVLTPTQQRLSLIVQLTVVLMLVCTPMIFIASYIHQDNVINLSTFRDAVVFVASIVPQGLVLTAILSLTIGALRISRFQTLVQRVNAVESMANVTVLCFDKTGTLTQNKLAVTQIIPLNERSQDDVKTELQLYLSNLSTLNRTAAAIAQYVNGSEETKLLPAVIKLREVPFTSQRKWGAVILPERTLIMGAPERVFKQHVEIERHADELAAQGLRVLAFARTASELADGTLSEVPDPIALIVLSDQVRKDIQQTLDAFRQQNVKLKIISGDNLETVREIAREAGMHIRYAYTGEQLEQMQDAEFHTAVMEGDLFARVDPETKRKIIAALKERGEYVAMTGDGVNDVPALKEANLAVVMNDGAQISKDIADIVLLNNAMTTLPRAFFEGRLITQTIFGTSKIFLVKNLYSTFFFIFAGFMAMPFPINPIQISWLTFGVINLPAGLIAFRLLKPEYMQQFRRDVLDYVVTGGFIGAASMSLLYAITYLGNNRDILEARSTMMLYLTLWGMLVFWNVHGVSIFKPRTIGQHPRVFLLGAGLTAVTILGAYLFPDVLNFVAPSPVEWAFVLLVFLFAMLLMHVTMRTRWFAGRLWKLTAP
jgi:cation-transporting ATPase E